MFRLIETSNRRLGFLIITYVAFLFFGALVFDVLESPYEAKQIKNLNEYVKLFQHDRSGCMSRDQLNDFIQVISNANDKGVPALDKVSKEQNWSVGQAVFFAGTILTTIGYGNVSPLTSMGKIFCILYAIIGIPTTLMLLYAMIERMMKYTSWCLAIFSQKVSPFLPFYFIRTSHIHIIFACVCALIVFHVFFIIPAAIYAHIENWSYLNSFYYCFISLSTVGLGDYVPGDSGEQKHRHLYKIFSTVYLIVGVFVMVWNLEIFSQIPELNVYRWFSLDKDAILMIHTRMENKGGVAAVTAASGLFEFERNKLDSNGAQGAYQQQINEDLPEHGDT